MVSRKMNFTTIPFRIVLSIHLFNSILKLAGGASSKGFNFIFFIELLIELGVQN
jgi:hypothetical protein